MKRRILSLGVLAALVLALALPIQGAETAASGAVLAASLAPSGMVRAGDTLYIADSYQRAVVALKDGEAALLAGRTDVTDVWGQPVESYRDGAFDQAAFSEPWAVVPYGDGLLVTDAGNHALRYLDLEQERVYTAAGTGSAGYQNGTGVRAAFDTPTGLAVGEDGTVYIADTGNHVIRAMDEDGRVTTFAGSREGCALGALDEALFSQPTGLCWADGVLYVADTGNHRVVAIADGQVTLVAGAALSGDAAYEGGYLNGPAEAARFASPQGVAVGSDGVVYIADTENSAVRVVKDGYVTTLDRGESGDVSLVSPRGLLAEGDTLLVGDTFSRLLLQYPLGGETVPVFQDVPEGAWYYDGVYFTAANGFFQGVGGGLFAPAANTTRGALVTVLARLDGVDTSGSDPWYEAGRQWGLETGVSDGTAPNRDITRQELVTMLYRYGGSPAVSGSLSAFPDGGDTQDWAVDGMIWAVENGLLEGDNGKLYPQRTATRMETATLLTRFVLQIWSRS